MRCLDLIPQDEAMSKEYMVRGLQSKARSLAAHTMIISDLQQSLVLAQEREEALMSDLNAHVSLTDSLTLELAKVAETIAKVQQEARDGPNARISALEDALQAAEALLANGERRGVAEQHMLKDVLKSLMARDEELASVREELDTLRSSVRASVAASRQSIAKDLNLALPLAFDENGFGSNLLRGHISTIDVGMIYSRQIVESRHPTADTRPAREQLEAETRVLDADASAYDDLADAYHRAAVYRQHVQGNQNALSAWGKELSDLECFERRMMGVEGSPDKHVSTDKVESVTFLDPVDKEEEDTCSLDERERELELQKQRDWEAVAERARAAHDQVFGLGADETQASEDAAAGSSDEVQEFQPSGCEGQRGRAAPPPRKL
jgi:hypothetical protein